MHGLLKLADVGGGTLQCKVNTTVLHEGILLSTDTPWFEKVPGEKSGSEGKCTV